MRALKFFLGIGIRAIWLGSVAIGSVAQGGQQETNRLANEAVKQWNYAQQWQYQQQLYNYQQQLYQYLLQQQQPQQEGGLAPTPPIPVNPPQFLFMNPGTEGGE